MKKAQNTLIALILCFLATANTAHAQSTDTIPPSKPNKPSVTITQALQVSVSWSASTDNIKVTGYYVYRSGTLIANTSGLTITDVVSPGVYSYTVAAYDAAGNVSSESDPSSLVTIIKDTEAPTAPKWVSLVPATSSIKLTWTASKDNVKVVGYYVFRNSIKVVTASPITSTSFTDTGLKPDATYTYIVQAYDAFSNSASSEATIITTVSDTIPPSTPLKPTAKPISQSKIEISWQATTDNVGVVGYYIYRDGSRIADISSDVRVYMDVGLAPSRTYLYSIAAYDAAKNVSLKSFSVEGITFPKDTSSPTTPSDIKVTYLSSTEIHLSWKASTDNVGIAGYYVNRDSGRIANPTSNSYVDKNLKPNTSHIYTLQAFDDANNLSATSSITVTTLSTTAPQPSPPPSSSGIDSSDKSTSIPSGSSSPKESSEVNNAPKSNGDSQSPSVDAEVETDNSKFSGGIMKRLLQGIVGQMKSGTRVILTWIQSFWSGRR
jgi:hypothetical protein